MNKKNISLKHTKFIFDYWLFNFCCTSKFSFCVQCPHKIKHFCVDILNLSLCLSTSRVISMTNEVRAQHECEMLI